VDDRGYQGPFKFTGKINNLTIALDPPKLTPKMRRGCKKPLAPRRTRLDLRAMGASLGLRLAQLNFHRCE
jgi:hypothetical protein